MSLTLLFVLIFAHWHFVVHSQSVLTRYKYCASPPIWVLSIAISMSFLSVDSHISKPHVQTSLIFLHLLPVAWSFSDDNAVCQSTSVLWMTFNRWRTVVSGTWKYDDPRLKMLHEGVLWTTKCVICFVIWPTTRILQWRNVNEYRLPSKNAHSPNYCSWLAVCVNYSANFYCKITLINRFKLYLIKTYSKTPRNKTKTTFLIWS